VTDEQDELREALKRVAVTLKGAAVPFALGGGYAAWALGGPEPEHDVDFVVAEDDAQRAERALAEAGLRVEHPPEDWLFKVFDADAMVDVLFRIGGDPVQGDLLERAVEVEVLSIRMPVLSATDTLASKLVALSEHACDFAKVLPPARALREQVDWAALRATAKGNPYAEACLFLLDRLGVAADQP
jgi:hypothetical protein